MKYLQSRLEEHLEIVGGTPIPDMSGVQRNSAQRIIEIARTIATKGYLLKIEKK